jgi:hypothetical protein
MLFSGAGASLLIAQFRDGGERSAVLRATSAASTPKPPGVDFYSTCLGESGNAGTADTAYSVAVGPNGQAYLAGYCGSAYPTTPGASQTAFAGSRDAFVTVIDPTLSGSASLIYSSRVGGGSGNNTDNYSEAVAVDAFGNAYIAGATTSPNFPSTPGAYQTNYKGGACYYGPCANVFISKFNPSVSGAQ